MSRGNGTPPDDEGSPPPPPSIYHTPSNFSPFHTPPSAFKRKESTPRGPTRQISPNRNTSKESLLERERGTISPQPNYPSPSTGMRKSSTTSELSVTSNSSVHLGPGSRRASGDRLSPKGPRRPSHGTSLSRPRSSFSSVSSISSGQSEQEFPFNQFGSSRRSSDVSSPPGPSRLRHYGGTIGSRDGGSTVSSRRGTMDSLHPPTDFGPRPRTAPSLSGSVASSSKNQDTERKPFPNPLSISVSQATPDRRTIRTSRIIEMDTPTTPTGDVVHDLIDPLHAKLSSSRVSLTSTRSSNRRLSQSSKRSPSSSRRGSASLDAEVERMRLDPPQPPISEASSFRERIGIDIPPRKSSNPNSPSRNSPSSPGNRPNISPRRSSIPENNGGDTYSALLDEYRQSSSPTDQSDFGVLSSSEPVIDRRNPGLVIDPPLPPPSLPHRSPSAQSPPVPAKSPLRSLSGKTSVPSRSQSQNQLQPTVSVTNTAKSPITTPVSTSTASFHSSEASKDRESTSSGKSRRASRFIEMDEFYEPSSSTHRSSDKEIRFTNMTFPSMYSQESVPPTPWTQSSSQSTSGGRSSEMLWSAEDLSPREPRFDVKGRRRSQMDGLWGRKKSSQTEQEILDTIAKAHNRANKGQDRALSAMKGLPPLPRLTMPEMDGDIVTSPETASAQSGFTIDSNQAVSGRPSSEKLHVKAVRSPSAPILGGPIQMMKALTPDTSKQSSALSRSPTAPSLSLSPARSNTSLASGSTKRNHLIREIAATERAYATDLALIRDAYLGKQAPGLLTPSLGGDSRRTSGTDFSMDPSTPEMLTPGYSTPSITTPSSVDLSPSPSNPVTHSGKPLIPTDLRAIFSNIDQLAAIADELATAFERASAVGILGDEASDTKDGDSGSDTLGQAFTSILPRLRPLYLFYCARQAGAAGRLMEVQADPGHTAYLRHCWLQIKSKTHAWNLDSMLIKPVQRVTKYPLLFDDLLAMTTPVHPDYFNIRAAAEQARALAVEIDEEKRRKDVVALAIAPRKALSTASPNKDKSKGLKIFGGRKEKPTLTHTKSTASVDLSVDISSSSMAMMTDLQVRFEQNELGIKRIGKEVVYWTAAAKEALFAEDQLINTWLKVIKLDETDPPEDRLMAFRAALKQALTGAWAALNEEIKAQVMPILATLLEAGVNPRKVIARRDAKLPEYARFVNFRENKKPIDNVLAESAGEFIALHTQLIAELPIFLDGYTRILDLAVVAFSQCQARYYSKIQRIIEQFSQRWIAVPRRRPSQVVDLDESTSANSMDGRRIVKLWHDSWAPYGNALENFNFSKNTPKTAPVRQFRSPPPPPSLALAHSASYNSNLNRSPSRSSSTRRRRSLSLQQQLGRAQSQTQNNGQQTLPLPSPSSSKDSSKFNLFKSKVSAVPRPVSLVETRNRHSFGLPKIIPEQMFEGIGLSPTKPSISKHHTLNGTNIRAVSDPHAYSDFATLNKQARGSEPKINAGLGFSTLSPSASRDGISHKAVNGNGHPENSTIGNRHPSQRKAQVNAADGWRNEPVLYQCACVASFDADRLGGKKYRGLSFLTMEVGDLFDIFHEVGRIDELPSFPYPQVGVDNDGVLVGRSEDGSIGLLVCSFLEPLRET